MRALRFFFLGFCGVLVGRLFLLQVVSAGFYEAVAEGQYSLYEELVPERGRILVRDDGDLTEYPVATDEPRARVFADPSKLEDPVDAGKRIARVLEIEGIEEYERKILIAELEAAGKAEELTALRMLDQDPCAVVADPAAVIAEPETCVPKAEEPNKVEQLIERLVRQERQYAPVARNVSQETLDRLLELEIPGLDYMLEDVRSYPEVGFGGHVLGFVGRDSEDEPVGQYGIEGYFQDFLAGKTGELYSQADGAGRWIGVGDRDFTPAVDGGDLMLTIDRTLQYTACKKLQDTVTKYDADGGALVIVEPSTGRILAMCGAPDFDSNTYASVEDISVYNNPAIFTPYEPGSIFKPVAMAAALDAGSLTPSTTFEDVGYVKIDDRTIRNAADKVYGMVTMTQVLEDSVNTGMVWVMRRAGRDVFEEYVRNFGFGTLSGLELNKEAPGTIAALDQPGEVYAATASFGQGITTTPLQMVMAYAAIANGGALMQPMIVDEMRYADGTIERRSPQKIRQVISAKTATTLSAMLVSVVEEGHGKRAGVKGYWIGGKTGTAQIAVNGVYSESAFNASFAGFGPIDDPKFAMIVKIENPKSDHILYAESTAAPLFGEVADFLLEYYDVAPERATE